MEAWTVDPSHPPGDVGPEVFSSRERAFAAVAGLVFTLSLAWRRRAPLAVLAVAIAMVVANFVVVLDATTILAIALVVVVYSVGAHTEGLRAWIGAAGVVALIGALVAQQLSIGDLLFIAMIVGGAWIAGRAIRQRRIRERALEREKAEAEAAIERSERGLPASSTTSSRTRSA